MNKIIADQLAKVRSTHMEFDDNTVYIHINRQTSIIERALVPGLVYIIEYDGRTYKMELESANDKYEFMGIEIIDGIEDQMHLHTLSLQSGTFRIISQENYHR